MKKPIKMIVATAALAALLGTGCSVEQTKEAKMPSVDVQADSGKVPKYEVVKTEEGEMPSVDVDGKAGQMPEFDVETADVDVTTETKTVKVPKMKVVVEEETVEVPVVDVDMPDKK